MADYKKMYFELLDKVEKAMAQLIEGERGAEEIYIQSSQREDEERPRLVALEDYREEGDKKPRP